MNEESLPNDLSEFAAALRSLSPAPVELNRDQLMFAAGEASATKSPARSTSSANRRWQFAWPLANAALILVCLTLGWRLKTSAGQPERVVYVERPAATSVAQASAAATSDSIVREHEVLTANAQSYLLLRERVLSGGVESLPDSGADNSASSPSYSAGQYRDLLNAAEGG